MSNLDPQPYDENAVKYDSENAHTINKVSAELGVSSVAVAGSISREITRADGEGLPELALHKVLLEIGQLKSERSYEAEYQKDLQSIALNPGILDGNPWQKYLSDPTVRDVGPGSIKVLTAIQIIKQYQDTPQGITLGLDKYKLTDLKAIVNDLSDRNSALSIKIAGLVILNGQKFFAGKSIDGIPWAKLTKEQQDAALTAYYTLGEHAVSVDMAKNEFFPFTPGPKGGKVGPWILFGNNYANLNTILAKGRSLGVTVAPVLRRKAPQKAPLPHKQHEAAGAFLTQAQKVLDSLSLGANNFTHTGFTTAHASAAKYLAKAGSLPRSSALRFGDGFVAEMNQRGSEYIALAQRRPGSLIHTFNLKQRDKAGVAPWAIGKANSALALSWLSHGKREALPSIAPISWRERGEAAPEQMVSRYSDANFQGAGQHAAPAFAANRKMDPRQLSGALDELLNHAARRPPNGATPFDPRLTPAWAGLQLPA